MNAFQFMDRSLQKLMMNPKEYFEDESNCSYFVEQVKHLKINSKAYIHLQKCVSIFENSKKMPNTILKTSDIIFSFVKFLSFEDLILNIQFVCIDWKKIVEIYFQKFSEISLCMNNFSKCEEKKNIFIVFWIVNNCPKLKQLSLDDCFLINSKILNDGKILEKHFYKFIFQNFEKQCVLTDFYGFDCFQFPFKILTIHTDYFMVPQIELDIMQAWFSDLKYPTHVEYLIIEEFQKDSLFEKTCLKSEYTFLWLTHLFPKLKFICFLQLNGTSNVDYITNIFPYLKKFKDILIPLENTNNNNNEWSISQAKQKFCENKPCIYMYQSNAWI